LADCDKTTPKVESSHQTRTAKATGELFIILQIFH